MLLVRLEKRRIWCLHLPDVLESSITSDNERPRGTELAHDRSKAIDWGLGWKSWLRRNYLSWGYRLVRVLIDMYSLMLLGAFKVDFLLFLANEPYVCLWDTLLAWYLVKLFWNEIVIQIVWLWFFMIRRVLLMIRISQCIIFSAVRIFYQILRETIFNFLALRILVI